MSAPISPVADRLAKLIPRLATEFVSDMTARLVCSGAPTEKQAAWLRAIFAKLRSADR